LSTLDLDPDPDPDLDLDPDLDPDPPAIPIRGSAVIPAKSAEKQLSI
jgi:hypothetical protein